MDVSITELRANLKANLERVKAGEEIVITDHGKPVAKLVPATDHDHWAELEAAGIVSPAPAGPRRTPARPQTVEIADGVQLSDLVTEQRG